MLECRCCRFQQTYPSLDNAVARLFKQAQPAATGQNYKTEIKSALGGTLTSKIPELLVTIAEMP